MGKEPVWDIYCIYMYVYFVKIYQFHAVSRTQQGRQREPSVKTLRSILSAGFWRHYVLSDRTQHPALHRDQGKEL